MTETWLNINILTSELISNNYTVYRRDRVLSEFQKKKDGGGVLVAVSKSFNSQRMVSWESSCEDIWVLIDIPNQDSVVTFALCAVYLPPPVTSCLLNCFLSNCNSVLDSYKGYKILIGDFNLKGIDWTTINRELTSCTNVPQHSTLCNLLIDFAYVYNLHQCNYIKNNKGRTLDLVLTDILCQRIQESEDILCPVDPLHPPFEFSFTTTEPNKLPQNLQNQRHNFYKADYNLINKHLSKINWKEAIGNYEDVNTMLQTFYAIVREIIIKFIPLNKTKRKYPPWFTRDLINLLNEKRKTRLRLNKYNNPLDKISLQLLTSRCKSLATQCYNTYIKRIEDSIVKNSKAFWT